MSTEIPLLSTLLLPWYEKFGRHDLPWQQNRTPYKVWLSEIMLQQTQVATVIPYFERFITDFPTLTDLAAAHQDDVLARWAGLGYYARGRNLHKTAQICQEKYDGKLPKTAQELVDLPGIGESTAAAVVSFSYGTQATILDGNVKRVLTRCFALKGDPNKAPLKPTLWEIAKTHTPAKNCAQYNQAIMDIGATLCTRTKPDCEICPISEHCAAYKLGTPTAFPDKAKAIKKTKETLRFLVPINPNGELGLIQRPEKGIWAKLWCFPALEEKESSNNWSEKNLNATAIKQFTLESFQHVLTHKRYTIETHVIFIDPKTTPHGIQWFSQKAAKSMGIPKPVASILRQLFDKVELV